MTEKEITAEVARIDGITKRKPGEILEYEDFRGDHFFQRVKFPDGTVRPCMVCNIPDYLTNGDEIRRVICEQPLNIKHRICKWLIDNFGLYEAAIKPTAKDLCEALLRALGKWKE